MPSLDTLTPGTIVAERYKVLRPIARGATATLVVAEHLGLRREVALKVLTPALVGSPEARARLLREARAIARVDSPHIARVLDVGALPSGAPFMALELLSGVDLQALSRDARLSPPELVDLVAQACEGLAAAHAAGIVHRGVKPANLFLTEDRDGPLVKVLGFGVAKDSDAQPELTEARSTVGATAYASPEQLRDPRDVDPRADVWSLGVVLHELLSGERPFIASSQHGLALAIALDPPRPLARPGVPDGLAAVVARCLSKDREDRYHGVAALAAALAPFGGPRAREAAVRLAATAPRSPGARASARPSPTGARLRLGLVKSTSARLDELEAGLSRSVGASCEIVEAGSYRALVELLRDQAIELAWLPPLAYLRARAVRAAHLLATLERGGAPSFGCAILGREGGPERLSELAGLRVAWTDPWSASGYVVPRAMMKQAGLDPGTAFSVELFVGHARAVLDALRGGAADVGSTHCVLGPSGTEVSGPWTHADGVRVLAVGGPVPCDALCASPALDAARRAELRARLLSPAPELLRALEATGTRDPDARLYEVFRLAFLT